MSRRANDGGKVVPSADDLLTPEELKGFVDHYASEIQNAIRGRLEALRDAYEERLRKRGEEWRKEADALLDRLSKAEAMVEELRSRIAGGEAELADDLRARGFEVIDKRVSGGSLWVMGAAAQLKPVMTELQRRGVEFEFAPKGGRATGGRPAWFTKAGSKVPVKTP